VLGSNGGSLDQSKMFDNGLTGNGIDIGQEYPRNIHSSIITKAMSGRMNRG